MAADESYPGDLKYHPEHDWARIEGDEATVGITWFAQDALGELVHFEAPEPGATVAKDASYGEVESVKAVSDVDRAALRRDPRGEPEGRRGARDRERGSLRRGLAAPDPALRPGGGRRAARRSTPTSSCSGDVLSQLSLTDSDREEMLAAIGVASVEELFRDIPAAVRFEGRLDLEPALSEPELVRHLEELAAKNVDTTKELSFLGAGDLRPLRAGGRRRGARARRVPDRVHAVPAGDEPGRAAGDLRVPDGDLRADRDGRLERVRLRRHDRRCRRVLVAKRRRPAARRSCSPRRSTRRCARS